MTLASSKLRKVSRYFLSACLLFLLFCSGILWYVTTASFQKMVRGRLIASLERVTGGRVELGSFHVTPLRFEVEVRDLTIHGREAAGQVPYMHVDSVSAIVNLSSALGAKLGFHSLTLQHPVAHIIFYPDGSTNQPSPTQQGNADFEQLFSFSVDRLNVRQGELLWQDQRIPLDFASDDVSASLNYSFLHRRYSGTLAIGQAETQFDGYRPVAWAGQASFAIDRNGIQVSSLKATAERSRLQASGVVVSFRTPAVKGTYELVLDLAQAAAVSRQPQLKAGTLQIQGDGSWMQQTFASSGKFDVRDASWQDKTFSAKNVSGSGQFSLDPRKISFSRVQGQIFRGSFTSDADIVNWQASGKPTKTPREEQRGAIKIRTKDVALAELLASLGQQFRPLNLLKFAGSLSSTSEILWRRSFSDAEITTAVDVSRQDRKAAGEIPLTGSAHAAYNLRSGDLEINDLAATTPASQVRASGAFSSSATVRFSFSTNDLREWQPVTSDLFPSGMPFLIHGRAAFNGTAAGKIPNISLAGNLQLQDFASSLSTSARAPAEQFHWDSLNADVQVSSRSLAMRNAVLRHGNATVKLEGNAALVAWNLAPSSPFHFRLEIQNADAGELARFITHDYAVSGRLNAGIELSGTVSKPQGQGTLNLSQGSIQGHAFDSANASLALAGTQLTFRDIQIQSGAARIGGDGTYDLASEHVQLSLAGANLDLAAISPLERSRIRIDGKLDFSAQASGTTSAPQVTANLHLRNVMLNDEMAGDYLLNAVSHGPDLRVTGHSDFKNAELLIDGNVQLRDQWPAHIDFHFTRLDVDPFLESYLRGHITGHSAVAGDLVLEGPLRNPQQLSVTGNLTDLYADVERVKLRNDGPIHFAISNRAFKIENFHVLGENTDFAGSGSMQLAGERALDFEGRGKIDLKLIQTYDPDFTSSGTLTGEARLSGTLDAPLVKGRLQVQNGSISDVNLPSALSEINGTFLFSQNRITIESLSAQTGGGTVAFTGHADLTGKQLNFDLAATADAVRLRYPPGVSSTASADLHWSGSSSGSLLSGDITIIKLGFTPGFDFGAYLERSVQTASLPQTDPVLNKIRLDLHVTTTPELQMQTSVIRLQGEADLGVRGNAAKPVLLGRADVFEGEAYFNGTKYRLERGGVTFNNPAVTTPFLDLEATTHIRDYDITLSMSGPADKPKVNYRSEPPLPTADIITLLAFGQTSEESAQLQQTSQSAFSQQASNAMLAAALNATLNNRTQRLFGNSRIKIDPQGLTTETSPTQSGPAVTIEQQVKDNITLTYTTNVAQTSQQVIRAEYNVTRNVSIVAIRDQNGIVSFDVKIRRRKR